MKSYTQGERITNPVEAALQVYHGTALWWKGRMLTPGFARNMRLATLARMCEEGLYYTRITNRRVRV